MKYRKKRDHKKIVEYERQYHDTLAEKQGFLADFKRDFYKEVTGFFDFSGNGLQVGCGSGGFSEFIDNENFSVSTFPKSC